MAAAGHLWFFLLSHLIRNYWVDSNETCLLGSPQSLSHSNEFVTRVKNSHVFATREKIERILHMCDKYVQILHTSKIGHLWKNSYLIKSQNWSYAALSTTWEGVLDIDCCFQAFTHTRCMTAHFLNPTHFVTREQWVATAMHFVKRFCNIYVRIFFSHSE